MLLLVERWACRVLKREHVWENRVRGNEILLWKDYDLRSKIKRQLQTTPTGMRSKTWLWRTSPTQLWRKVYKLRPFACLKKEKFHGKWETLSSVGYNCRVFPWTTHGDQRMDLSPLPEKMQASRTANRGWNKLSILLRSSCSSSTNSEGPERSGNLRSKRWKASKRSPYLSSWQLDCSIQSSLERLIYLLAKGPLWRATFPPETWAVRKHFMVSGLFASLLTFNTTGLVWGGQMFGWRFGIGPRNSRSGRAMEMCAFWQLPMAVSTGER